MTDDHGHPDLTDENGDHTQTVSLSTTAAAQQLDVDSRTVRRYILEGIRASGGGILRLKARQINKKRGPEWQIYQTDLDRFKEERDRAATEGYTPGAGTGAAGQQLTIRSEENQTLALQLIASELERRSAALSEAQQTIERLAHEAGRQAGRAQELERELEAERQHVKELEQDRNYWQQKAQELPAQPRRVRLLPWQKKED